MGDTRKRLDVVVVGELNVDLILTGLPGLPTMGRCTLADDMEFTLGSASAIFASNIAKLGARVGFVGKIGDDELGEFILRHLRRRHIELSQIRRDPAAKTGVCVSLSFPENYAMASYAGVRETMTVEDVDFDYVGRGRHLHMSSYYLQPGMLPGCPRLFRAAKERGLSTSLDPDADSSGKWSRSIFELLAHVDIFLPNEQEALSITGCAEVNAALKLLNETVPTVVIKRGSGGALAGSGGKVFSASTFSVTVVDTTGAGDSFNAGFIHRYLTGATLPECLLWGSACAALSTTAAGGTTAFPSLDEAATFLREREREARGLISTLDE